MKLAALVTALLYSSFALAGNLFSIEQVSYDVTRSQKQNDIVFCKAIEADHNIVSGCYNLNLLKNYTVKSNAANDVLLISNSDGHSLKIGTLNTTKRFLLDDMDKGTLKEVLVDEEAQFNVNLLSKKGIALNTDLGCKAPFECDWNIFTTETKLSIEIILEGKRLEKVKLY